MEEKSVDPGGGAGVLYKRLRKKPKLKFNIFLETTIKMLYAVKSCIFISKKREHCYG